VGLSTASLYILSPIPFYFFNLSEVSFQKEVYVVLRQQSPPSVPFFSSPQSSSCQDQVQERRKLAEVGVVFLPSSPFLFFPPPRTGYASPRECAGCRRLSTSPSPLSQQCLVRKEIGKFTIPFLLFSIYARRGKTCPYSSSCSTPFSFELQTVARF